MLRFGIVDPSNKNYFDMSRGSNTSPRFMIDSENGVITATPDLLPGLYRFNVSVTDGKFIVYAPVTVDVSDIDQDALDHSVSIQLRRLSAKRFITDKMRLFYDLLAREIGVSPASIRILSIQNQDNDSNEHFRRFKRLQTFNNNLSTHNEVMDEDLDILFTVLRGELSARGYYRPTYIKQKIENAINTISTETG